MAGVAGVAVGPGHRGRGVATALMTEVAVRARDLGYPISALYPASVPVYRAVGWELAGRQYRVSVPGDALRTLARGLGAGSGCCGCSTPPAAFAGRGYPAGPSVDVAVSLTDPQLPDLDGPWRLQVADGAGSFVRADAAGASGTTGDAANGAGVGGAAAGSDGAHEVGPRGLAALFAGTRLSVLRRAGLVTGGTSETDRALNAALAGTPFLLDYF